MLILPWYLYGNYWGVYSTIFFMGKSYRCLYWSYHICGAFITIYTGIIGCMFSNNFLTGSKCYHGVCTWVINAVMHILPCYFHKSYGGGGYVFNNKNRPVKVTAVFRVIVYYHAISTEVTGYVFNNIFPLLDIIAVFVCMRNLMTSRLVVSEISGRCV